MFSKLLVAFFILCNHFDWVISADPDCSSASIEFNPNDSPPEGTVELICRDSVSSKSRYLCRDGGSGNSMIFNKPITTLSINETNEGKYTCCCSSDCTDCKDGTPLTILAGPRNTSAPTKVNVPWGAEYFEIQCPYIPGPLVKGYDITWRIDNFVGGRFLTVFTASNNTLRVKSFNPLDFGNYTCTVSTSNNLVEPKSEQAIVEVSVEENSDVETKITTGPSSIVLNETNNGIIDFHCAALISSFKLIGFSINQMDDSEPFEIIQNKDTECEKSNSNSLICRKKEPNRNATLTCSYDDPYKVDCTLTLEQFQTQSSTVSCFITEFDGSRLEGSETESQIAGIFTIPEGINCSIEDTSNNKRVSKRFPYPITVTPVVEFFDSNNNSIANRSVDLDTSKTEVSFEVLDGAVTYKIMFGNVQTELSCPVPDSPTMTPSPTMIVPPSSPATPNSISSSSMPSPTITDTDTYSPSPTAAFPTPPTTNSIVNTAIVTSVAGFIGLLLIIAVLIVLLVVITRLTKGSGKRKGDYKIAQNGSPVPTMDVESGNQMRSMQFLSPEHAGNCDSCSQASTLDTFIGEENSPIRNQGQRSNNSNSSHSHSSNSCPSTRHLKNKPLPRYGIPDHHPQQYQLQPTSLHYHANPPEISVILPTPTMEDQPVLGGGQYISDCISPTGTEPFSSPITPMEEHKQDDYFTTKKEQSRPSDLPIGPSAKSPESAAATPLSDQTMIGVLLYLQHKECNKRDNCQTCKLIDRHFVRIANKYGQNALTGMMKNLNTPGAEGTLKHLRKKKIQKARSPHRPQQAPSLAVAGYQRQRSHSASHLDDEELTFSSTETDEDSLKPSNKRIKPMRGRKAVTDDEREPIGYLNQRSLPLQRISETLSLSHNDIASTPLDCPPGVVLPSSFTTKGSESDSTDGSTTSRIMESQFDSSKPSGLSMSFMKSPEESLPVNLHSEQEMKKHLSTMTSYSASSGYETDNVFDRQRTLSSDTDERGESPPQHIEIPVTTTTNSINERFTHSDIKEQSTSSDYRHKHHDSSSDTHSYRSQGSNNQSDYYRAATRRSSNHQLPSHLSPSNSGVLSMHSSPGYRTQGSTSGGSNQSNNSIRSESALLQNHSRNHKQQFSSPPGQRRNTRTPSPIQFMLPSQNSSATPI